MSNSLSFNISLSVLLSSDLRIVAFLENVQSLLCYLGLLLLLFAILINVVIRVVFDVKNIPKSGLFSLLIGKEREALDKCSQGKERHDQLYWMDDLDGLENVCSDLQYVGSFILNKKSTFYDFIKCIIYSVLRFSYGIFSIFIPFYWVNFSAIQTGSYIRLRYSFSKNYIYESFSVAELSIRGVLSESMASVYVGGIIGRFIEMVLALYYLFIYLLSKMWLNFLGYNNWVSLMEVRSRVFLLTYLMRRLIFLRSRGVGILDIGIELFISGIHSVIVYTFFVEGIEWLIVGGGRFWFLDIFLIFVYGSSLVFRLMLIIISNKASFFALNAITAFKEIYGVFNNIIIVGCSVYFGFLISNVDNLDEFAIVSQFHWFVVLISSVLYLSMKVLSKKVEIVLRSCGESE